MVLVLTFLAFAAVAAFEIGPLRKRERRGELITAGAIWLIALIYGCLQVLRLPVPNINAPITALFGGG